MYGHNRHLHLHGLQNRDRRPRLHVVTRSDGHGNDQRRRWRPYHSSFVSRHTMGDPLDLHQVIRAIGYRLDREGCPVDHEPASEAAKRLDLDVYRRAVGLDLVTTGGVCATARR